MTAHACTVRSRVSQHNLALHFRLKSEHCKEHLSSRSRATMSQESSPLSNRLWHTKKEASHASESKPTATLALMLSGITTANDNLTMRNCVHPLSFQRVQTLLTLFSKSFSSFPHGTCLLSVSSKYLAWDEIYHPICAPIPRNVTLRKYAEHEGLQMEDRTLTLKCSLFQAACTCAPVSNTSWNYNSKPEATISMLSLSKFIRHYWRNPI